MLCIIVKALISLRECEDWSEPLLIAYTPKAPVSVVAVHTIIILAEQISISCEMHINTTARESSCEIQTNTCSKKDILKYWKI